MLLNRDTPRDPKDDYSIFDYIDRSIIKTSTMFVGEFEFGNLPFKKFGYELRFPFLLFFILLTVVVMMNLLNALAITDTTKLLEEAEVLALASDAEIIYSMVS